ncbi:MAG: LPXTG cell wall anchor domain-containing protein [Actinobacteria bacterium]|nr:MAG: LPXTG cell wall anchor domain-containing protein [Actinomycetota bacterium]
MTQPKILGSTAAAAATLPVTGSQPLLIALVALAMIAGGALLVRAARIRA